MRYLLQLPEGFEKRNFATVHRVREIAEIAILL
jgi:hypothetical protein